MQNKYFRFIIIALAVAIIVPQIAFASWWNPMSWGWVNRVFHFQQTVQKQEKQQDKVACTMDAKLCSDGSYVGREGPKCEFKSCPETKKDDKKDNTASWKTYTSSELKYSFKYPSDWRVIPNSAYSAAGYGGLVGYTITKSNSKTPTDNERIDIGGAQVDCASLSNLNRQEHPAGVLCKTNYPVYTFSTDPNVISVFNSIVSSIKDITTTDPIAGWKTYKNSEYGFEIKYPSSWFYKQYSWGPKLSGASGRGIAFCPVGKYNEQNCTVEPMMNTRFAPIFINTGIEPIVSSSLILSEDGQIYKDIYNQMLSTFKFIESSDKKVLINSIYPSSGSVGTKIEISGSNLN